MSNTMSRGRWARRYSVTRWQPGLAASYIVSTMPSSVRSSFRAAISWMPRSICGVVWSASGSHWSGMIACWLSSSTRRGMAPSPGGVSMITTSHRSRAIAIMSRRSVLVSMRWWKSTWLLSVLTLPVRITRSQGRAVGRITSRRGREPFR